LEGRWYLSVLGCFKRNSFDDQMSLTNDNRAAIVSPKMKNFFGLLLVFAAAVSLTFSQIVETNPPPDFMVLLKWAGDLSATASAWNGHCAKEKPDPNCAEYGDRLKVEMKAFVENALAVKSEGADCRAQLKMRVISHEIRLMKWNLDCGGQKPNTACIESEKEIDAESDSLAVEVKVCLGTAKPL
jgi:hypothetical protein